MEEKEKLKVKYHQVELPDDEEILWEGSPKVLPIITQQKFNLIGDLEPVLLTLLFLGSIFYSIFVSFTSWGKNFFFLLIVAYFYVKYLNIKKVHYKITDQYVYIRTWFWGMKKTRRIPHEEIGAIQIERFGDHSGTIHFLPNTKFGFRTRSLITGAKRHYPTFELIKELDDVEDIMKHYVNEVAI